MFYLCFLSKICFISLNHPSTNLCKPVMDILQHCWYGQQVITLFPTKNFNKMLYTIFLVYIFLCWTNHFFYFKGQKNVLKPYMSYCHISSLPMLYILIYLSSVSVFVYTMTSCIKRDYSLSLLPLNICNLNSADRKSVV